MNNDYRKTRQRAVSLSLTAVLSAVLVLALSSGIEFLLNGAALTEPQVFDLLAALVLSPLLVGIPALLLTLVLLGLDEDHFGRGARFRWALTGLLFGLVWAVASRLLPDIASPIVSRLLAGALQVAAALWVYWLVFRVVPPLPLDESSGEADNIAKP
jgi:hypothetical protein